MNGPELLISFLLTDDRLREQNAGRERGGRHGKC